MRIAPASIKVVAPASIKVSAIIPAFNRRQFLLRAIESVLVQTLPVDEIVFVDDGSTDGSADLVEARYGDQVRVVRQANTGVAGARHRGIREARGEWIAFLDSDDEWLPDRNRQLCKAADVVPNDVAWIFGTMRLVTDEGPGMTMFEEHGLTLTESPQIFADALTIQYPYQFPMLQASFIRRAALLESNCFSEGLRSDDDLLASFQLACRHKFAAIPDVVGNYFRTADLAASSVIMNGNFGPDYYRSRMLAFESVIHSGRRRPWNAEYASATRALCQVLARRGKFSRELAWQQFRYGGASFKGVAFLAAALLGKGALRAWDNAAAFARKHLRSSNPVQTPDKGLRAYLQSVGKR